MIKNNNYARRMLAGIGAFAALFILVALSFGTVRASTAYQVTDTVTPTPDVRRTPPSTPVVSGGSGNLFPTFAAGFDCPVGLPEGYGVVTPSSLYMAVCAQCMPTVTPWPTGYEWPTALPTVCVVSTVGAGTPSLDCSRVTPGPVVTGTATVTPTPYSTSYPSECVGPQTATPFVGTPVPGTNMVDCYDAAGDGDTCLTDNDTYVEMEFSGYQEILPVSGSLYVELFPRAEFQQLTYHIRMDAHEVSSYSTNILDVDFRITSNGYGDFLPYFNVLTSPPGLDRMGYYENWGFVSARGYPSNGQVRFQFASYADKPSNSTTTIYLEVWSYVQCMTSPVTATPVPSSDYCSVIRGEDDLSMLNDIDFWGRSDQPISCLSTPAIDIPEIAATFEDWFGIIGNIFIGTTLGSWLLSSDAVFPAQTICFVPYDFETVSIFGVMLNWALFIDIFIIGYALAHFTSK